MEVITEVFQLNPHSVHTLNKHQEGIYAVALDNLHIVYTMNTEKTECKVVKILYADNSAPTEKLRTKEWLDKMNEIMDFRGFKQEDGEEEFKNE